MKKQVLWTRDFTFVFIINFLVALVFYLLMITMAPYAIYRFDASSGVAGLATGIFIFGSLVGRFLIGRVIDGVGSRKVMILSRLVHPAAADRKQVLPRRLLRHMHDRDRNPDRPNGRPAKTRRRHRLL